MECLFFIFFAFETDSLHFLCLETKETKQRKVQGCMKIPKNLRFIRGARKLASLKQPPLLFLINLDFLNGIFIRPSLIND